MNSLFSIIIKISVLIIIDSIVFAVTDHSKNGRVVRSVTIIVTLLVATSGLASVDYEKTPALSIPSYSPDTDAVWQGVTETVEKTLSDEMTGYCSSHGLEVTNINVEVECENDRFEAKRVDLSGRDAETAKKLIAGHFKIPLAYININGD